MQTGISNFYECEQCKNIFTYSSTEELSICPLCGYQFARKMENQLETPAIEMISNDQLSTLELKKIFSNYIKICAIPDRWTKYF